MDAWRAAEEFGKTLGLTEFNLDSGGAEVTLDTGAKLGILLCDRDVVVHVVHPAPHPGDAILMRLLQGAEARDLPGFALQVGCRGIGAEFCLVGAVRVAESAMSPDALSRAAERLLAWAELACRPA